MGTRKKIISTIVTGAFLLSLILLLTGCSKPASQPTNTSPPTVSQATDTSQPGNTIIVKSADGMCSLEVPAGWNTKDATVSALSPNSAIAVSNDANKRYLLVIKPSTSIISGVTLSQYFDALKSSLNGMVTNPSWSSTSNVTIGGMDGIMISVSGKRKTDGTDYVYFIYSLRGKKDFYSIIAFTTPDMETINQPVLQSIVNTFKEN